MKMSWQELDELFEAKEVAPGDVFQIGEQRLEVSVVTQDHVELEPGLGPTAQDEPGEPGEPA